MRVARQKAPPRHRHIGAPPCAAPVNNAAVTAVPSFNVQFDHCAGVLNPIAGLFDPARNPVVSIKDAAAKLPFDLKAQLWSARQWVKKGPIKSAISAVPELTPDMAMSIWLYTCESPLYTELNAALRMVDRGVLRTSYFPYLRLLVAGMTKVKAQQGFKLRMVNRGVKLDLVEQFPEDYVDGESLVWWAVTSTTSKLQVLSNPMFLGSSGRRTIFQVHTKYAVDVSQFSAIPGEHEYVLPPAVVLQITGILKRDASGLTIISCEDDPDAPELIT